jgi:hypothetical protein
VSIIREECCQQRGGGWPTSAEQRAADAAKRWMGRECLDCNGILADESDRELRIGAACGCPFFSFFSRARHTAQRASTANFKLQ